MANQARQRQEKRAVLEATIKNRLARGAPPLFPKPPPAPPPQGPHLKGFNKALRTIGVRPAGPLTNMGEENNPLARIQIHGVDGVDGVVGVDGGYKHKLRRRKTRHKRKTRRKARRTRRSIK